MRAVQWVTLLLAVWVAACDPNARCKDAIQSAHSEINAAREKETDIHRINAIVQAGMILMDAEHDRNSANYDACYADVDRAKAELARVLSQ